MAAKKRAKAIRNTQIALAFTFLSGVNCAYGADNISSSAALTLTGLFSNADEIDNEAIAVLDVDIEGQLKHGRFHIYLEGTSTSKAGKVSAVYGESYADAGAAADSDGDGRIQISAAQYYFPLGSGELVAGLLYPSGFTESADWTNDETTQFISSSFVNIQTSGAPDYALGLGYSQPLSNTLSLNLLASQAQGLGDLNGEYGDLLEEFDDYFFAAELVWQEGALSAHLATWMSTLDTQTFSGTGQDNNQGINASFAYSLNNGLLVLRYGMANEKVSDAETFWGLSWQQTLGKFSYGLGSSVTQVSEDLKRAQAVKDRSQSELYVKYNAQDNLHITWSLQYIEHSGFSLDIGANPDVSPLIMAARLSYEF